ncbi:Hypothetical predicted protein [Mytilus galloprovincialis]|uniref:MADF domain-containing protein n=1 Tax=Mytilus galloprovincialis TaxID=29158 RepID=A0A8B6E2V1_MYTGA|nr:Hypothetical predicted protein [Mytilus galloprovincialis]
MGDTDAREENGEDLGKDVLLIELYEAEPALWNVHSAAYRDKYERKKSVDRIDSIIKIGASIHTGLGERHVNGFLSTLKTPPVSHRMFDERQKEFGTILGEIAEKSMKEWSEKEEEYDERPS